MKFHNGILLRENSDEIFFYHRLLFTKFLSSMKEENNVGSLSAGPVFRESCFEFVGKLIRKTGECFVSIVVSRPVKIILGYVNELESG